MGQAEESVLRVCHVIGQVFGGSGRGVSTASTPIDRTRANQGMGEVPKLLQDLR